MCKRSKFEDRSLKLLDVMDDLEEAKKIIEELIWPPDSTEEQRRAFEAKAARFAGYTVPQYDASNQESES